MIIHFFITNQMNKYVEFFQNIFYKCKANQKYFHIDKEMEIRFSEEKNECRI